MNLWWYWWADLGAGVVALVGLFLSVEGVKAQSERSSQGRWYRVRFGMLWLLMQVTTLFLIMKTVFMAHSLFSGQNPPQF
jgi:hypothetical protein